MTSNTPKLSPHAVHKLKWVREKILSHPELYAQNRWRQETQCGTVCCIGGWVTLGDPEVESHRCLGRGLVILDRVILDRAQTILGLDSDQSGELFAGCPSDARFGSNDPAIRAQAGAEHIDRFIERYT